MQLLYPGETHSEGKVERRREGSQGDEHPAGKSGAPREDETDVVDVVIHSEVDNERDGEQGAQGHEGKCSGAADLHMMGGTAGARTQAGVLQLQLAQTGEQLFGGRGRLRLREAEKAVDGEAQDSAQGDRVIELRVGVRAGHGLGDDGLGHAGSLGEPGNGEALILFGLLHGGVELFDIGGQVLHGGHRSTSNAILPPGKRFFRYGSGFFRFDRRFFQTNSGRREREPATL